MAAIEVELQKVRVKEAKVMFEEGQKHLLAEYGKEYARLKSEYDRACLVLEREQAVLDGLKSKPIEAAAKRFSKRPKQRR